MKFLRIRFSYLVLNDVRKVIKEENPEVLERNFELSCEMLLAIRRKELPETNRTVWKKIDSLSIIEEQYFRKSHKNLQTRFPPYLCNPRSERNDDSVAQPVEHNTFNVVLGSKSQLITQKEKPKGVNKRQVLQNQCFVGLFIVFGYPRPPRKALRFNRKSGLISKHYKNKFGLH